MNEIQRLIHEMCLDGVPMVALGEIGSLIRGNGLQKKDFVDHGVGCIHYGQIYTRFGLFTNKTLAYVSESLANKLTPVESGNLVIACTSENVEDVCKCVAWLGDQSIVTGGHAVVFKHSQNPKYIAYCFTSEDFQIQKRKYAFGAKVIDIKIDKLASIQIPLPPLPIQQRIVEILDKFTSLVSSLDSEIALRQKQYEYYRNKLLSFEEGEFEWKTLPEISTNCDRQRKPITGSKRIAGRYPYYGASGIVDYVESYIFDGNYLLISEDGANLLARSTPIAFSIEGKNWVNNHAHVLKFENMDTQRIVELYLNSIDLTPWISGAAQPKLNQDNLNKIPIPIPSLDRQLSIVRTLDTFESLLTNLKKERELRQKQYEYYREKLLTFA